MIRSRRLGPGARISLVAPAGPLPEGAIERAVERVRSFGWEPEVGPHAHFRRGYLAGTDAERAADLQAAVDSAGNDAIWCLRGGYGTMRILSQLDLTPLRHRPRPLIGFSDNTALHLALQAQGVVSFHGPHPATTDLPAFSADGLLRLLGDPAIAGRLPLDPEGEAPRTIVAGEATGPLVGGNLSLLAATVGTPFEIDARGAIVLIEEIGEPVYRIDRLLSQLLLSGALDGCAGIAIGAFSDCPDEGNGSLPTTDEVLADRLAGLGVPIVAGLPFGHIDRSWTLPLGVTARLVAGDPGLELIEPAVAP